MAALLSIATSPASAQRTARITGTVSDEAGAAASYALVALVSSGDPSRQHTHVLTDDAGRYVLAAVPAGRFRLRVSRIGYEPHTTPAFDVGADAHLTRNVVVRTEPIVIEALVVTGVTGCHALDELGDAAPDVANLWQEAVKGIEIKRAFLRSYRRTVDMRIETHQDNRLIRDVHDVDVQTMTVPDSAALAREAAEEAASDEEDGRYGERGATSFSLSLPSEQVMTDPEMLRGYCVEEQVTHSGDGALGLHFRPASSDLPGVTIEGAVFIEEDDYRIRGLAYRYYLDDEFVGTGEWVYGNVRVPGDVLRLPVRGSLRMLRIPPPAGLMIREFDVRISYSDYRDFEPLGNAMEVRDATD